VSTLIYLYRPLKKISIPSILRLGGASRRNRATEGGLKPHFQDEFANAANFAYSGHV
jgi:hypothetical protein